MDALNVGLSDPTSADTTQLPYYSTQGPYLTNSLQWINIEN